MNNRKFSAIHWLQNFALFMFSLTFILLIGEWLFPKYLNKIPFRLYGGVETNLRVLAQYSKRSVLPENYIAILGDSNSVGLGDFYNDLRKNTKKWYPDYSPAHFINKKLGRDVISFGFSGTGSFDSIWSTPVSQFKYINSRGFYLEPPKTILVLFYEGNDIVNNLQFVLSNYKGNEGIEVLVHSIKFNEWLNLQFLKSIEENDIRFEESFIFTKFLIKSVKNIFTEIFEKREENERFVLPATQFSHAIINGNIAPLPIAQAIINANIAPFTRADINGNIAPLPMYLQAPPIFQDAAIGRIGYYIFERAVENLIKYFPDSDIKIIYLPSVLSSYKIVSAAVSFQIYFVDGRRFDPNTLLRVSIVGTNNLFQKHLQACREILKISQKLKISFFDTTKHLRIASSKGFIHGPKDWKHLNESGYRALSDSISQFLLHPDEPYQNC